MAEIKVDASLLRGTSETINGCLSEFTGLTDEIRSGINSLVNSWEGSAAESFKQ